MTLKNLTVRAKVQLGVILSAALAMQVDQVKDAVMPMVAHHPHVASFLTGTLGIVTLLQNPAIERLLNIEEHEDKTVAKPDGTVVTTNTVTTGTVTKE